MKIVFMGTPQFADIVLKALIQSHHDIIAVVTQPDKPVGRQKKYVASSVKETANLHNIPIYQPNKIKTDYDWLMDLNPDVIVTAAYGQMIPKELLDRFDAINVHGSLLPKYRGGAPIQYALFDGLKETGITIMYMAYQMDSGDIIKQSKVEIERSDDYQTLSIKLAHVGAKALIEVLDDYEIGKRPRTPQQVDQVSFAYTLKRMDEYLDFHQTSDKVIQRLRGLTPEPGGFFILNGHTIKVYNMQKSDIMNHTRPGMVISIKNKLIISTQDGAVEILELLIPGKKKMKAKDFLNGQNIINLNDEVLRKEDVHDYKT